MSMPPSTRVQRSAVNGLGFGLYQLQVPYKNRTARFVTESRIQSDFEVGGTAVRGVPARTTVARRLYLIGMGLERLSSKNGGPDGHQTHLVGMDARRAFDVKIGVFSAPVRAVHANRH
jgi:hypothetical protein